METETKDAVLAAVKAFNAALIAASLASADGARMKIRVRTMPDFGATPKCPQVEVEFGGA